MSDGPDQFPSARDPSARTAALGLGLVMAACVVHASTYPFLVDDAYIYFRYAKNWVDGLGPVFNAGEAVEGYTGFLWLAWLRVAMGVGLRPESAAFALGWTCSALTLVTIYRAWRRWFPDRPAAHALIAPALLAVHRTFVAWSSGGLETALFTFLVTIGWARRLEERHEPDWFPWSGLFFAAATLTRLEGALFFGLTLAAEAGLALRDPRAGTPRPVRSARLAIGLALFAAPVIAHLLWRHHFYGAWLPNTFHAKVPGTRFEVGLPYLATFLIEHAAFLVLPIVLAGVIRPGDAGRRAHVAFAWFVVCVYMLYIAAVGGDHFEYRLLHPILPIVALLVADGCSVVEGQVKNGRSVAIVLAVAVALVSGLIPQKLSRPFRPGAKPVTPYLGEMQFGSLARIPPFAQWFDLFNRTYAPVAARLAGIRIENLRYGQNFQLAQAKQLRVAMDAGLVRRGDVIALGPVGIIPYVTGLTTVDIFGLTDATVARSPQPGSGLVAHEKQAPWSYLKSRGVAFIPLDSMGFFMSRQDIDRYRKPGSRDFYVAQIGNGFFAFYSTLPRAKILAMMMTRGFAVHHFKDGEAIGMVGK